MTREKAKVEKYDVRAARKLPNGTQKWVTVGLLVVSDDGTGAFYPHWLPDTTYRIFKQPKEDK